MERLGKDRIAKAVAQRPDRLVGLASVPMQDTALACLELERCVNDLNLKGMIISSNVNGIERPSLPMLRTDCYRQTLTSAERRGCRRASPAAGSPAWCHRPAPALPSPDRDRAAGR